MYIFFKPETLQIMGGSDLSTAMEFPYVETVEDYTYFGNLAVERPAPDQANYNSLRTEYLELLRVQKTDSPLPDEEYLERKQELLEDMNALNENAFLTVVSG